ncbi:hypothetical protein ACFLTW_01645 [Chloroflexota bacterium]
MNNTFVRTIDRFFNYPDDEWEILKKDLKPLIKLINSSNEEYNLQFRQDCFNIYYQGNSVAQVTPKIKSRVHTAKIHKKFLSEDLIKRLTDCSTKQPSGKEYLNFSVPAEKLHRFFQRAHLDRISGQIRKVHNGEEITMEQVIVTDNPPVPEFFIIDRQVADHLNWARIDLLGLECGVSGEYHFVVFEIKLGRNPELQEKAGRQVNKYVQHIKKHLDDYAFCYQKNYEQKKQLGLFNEEMPNQITIDNNTNSIEGIVVAGGYSQLAEKNIEKLNSAIEKNGWDIAVKAMPRMLLVD